MTQVFHVYFRVLRRHTRSALLAPVLDGLQKHAHLVNIDFVDDLFKQLYTLVDEHVSVNVYSRRVYTYLRV